jgi:glycosyltransferase involved in cell wall biosynthesis
VVAIRYRLQIVHARSYVPSVIALALHNLVGVKFVFDMRGFWADERVDGGLWRVDSRLFRMAKWFESRFLLNADHVVSLTWTAKSEIEKFSELRGRVPPITVVPTCVDLERFRPLSGRRDGFVLGYVGSAGTWYNFESAAQCFGLLRQVREDARFLILNRGEHDLIRTELERQGIPNAVIELRTVEYSEIPSQMARMHAGVFFIKPLYSKLASMPTKLAEFLACGVPCISNQRIGDMTEILEGERVGVAVPDFTETSIYNGLDRLLKLTEEDGLSDRCAAAAQMHFSLDEGVKRYAAIYERLAGSK